MSDLMALRHDHHGCRQCVRERAEAADEIQQLRETIVDLIDYADNHRGEHHPRPDGTRPCGCPGSCYEEWMMEKASAETLIGDGDND